MGLKPDADSVPPEVQEAPGEEMATEGIEKATQNVAAKPKSARVLTGEILHLRV